MTSINDEILAHFLKEGAKDAGKHLREITCPACGEKEAWAYKERPLTVICQRGNKCGEQTSTRTIYPGLFKRVAKYHPATKARPNATAEAYLRTRGFDPARFKGWFTQGETADPADKSENPIRYPTVQFSLSNGVAYHRLIDYSGRNKNKIVAGYTGHCWMPPQWKPGGVVWLVEGVLDALSLIQAGKDACANISSKHVPQELFDRMALNNTELVIAQDNDKAGRDSANKLAGAAKKRGIRYRFAFPPEGRDWNDLLIRRDLSETRVTRTLERAEWQGRLHGATSPEEYWEQWKERRRTTSFEFRGEEYIAQMGKEGGWSFTRISDFVMVRLYRLRKEPITDRPQYSEVVSVTNANGEIHEVMLGSAALAKNQTFREVIFRDASSQWDGTMDHLNKVLRKLRRAKVPVVREIELKGYDRRSDSYFFPSGAYGPDGRRVEKDDRGIVSIGRNHYSLPPLTEDEKNLWLLPEPGLDIPALIDLLERSAPHGHALSAMGFFAASLFASHVAGKLGMFPYLSLYGDTHTGKSTILELLNRMLGRDEEGMPLSESSTAVGTALYVASLSNYPLVLIEADANEKVSLNSAINTRTAYNRGAIRIKGTKEGGYIKTPFRGTLVFGWNDEVFPDAKVRERTVSLRFLSAENSPDKLDALTTGKNISPQQMAGFLSAVMASRKEIVERILSTIPTYSDWFAREGVEITRTCNNHAVPLAGLNAVLHNFVSDAHRAQELFDLAAHGLLDAAKRRERELREDPDDIQHFFERIGGWIKFKEGRPEPIVNDYGQEGIVAINMVEVENKFGDHHVPFHRTSLFKALRASPHFRKANYPFRKRDGTQVKCWAFDAKAFQ